MADPVQALTPVLTALGVGPAETLRAPSWNGTPLGEVYPWGTIRTATPAANRATAMELSEAERAEIPELGLAVPRDVRLRVVRLTTDPRPRARRPR